MMPDTAHTAVFTSAGSPLEIREYPVLAPPAGTARIGLLRSGICGTDIHIVEGRLSLKGPMTLGHEFVGCIEALGEGAVNDGLGEPLAVGDTAIACVAIPCGNCFNCRRGETASCLHFGVTYAKDPAETPHFFGGFSEMLFSPAGNLVRLPDGICLDAVAAFPCAGPTAIRAFTFAGGLEGDELVVVQGTGPVGLFAIAWAAARGCRVIAIGSGSNPLRTELARKLGAEEILDFRATTAEERLGRVTEIAAEMGRGNGADVVFESSGAPAAIPEGLNLVRTLGRYIVPGQYSAGGGVEIQPQLITFKAIHIVGSGQYKLCDIRTYLEFLRNHPDLQEACAACITHKYSVREANQALRNASSGISIKGVFSA